ncbi:MAG: glycerol-3-phosphate 1-O-acyltransferase PlsY [Oscillospiraceae bacterium]|jgi:glycerol-3-phosphate acyltransferase PlsY|nr:glycerol-3-phosphate 1-O-acyltransferase PlsY [Oscillospiraceae bacterium]
MPTPIAILLSLCVAYCLGSLNTSIVFSLVFYKKDIRTVGSKNAGATNTLRTFGPKIAFVVLLIDIAKGAAAVMLARSLCPTLAFMPVAAALAAVAGHILPVFFGFRGGKGVAIGAGVVLGLQWPAGLACLVLFVILVSKTKYVSVGSMSAAAALPVFSLLTQFFITKQPWNNYWWTFGFFLFLSAAVFYTHRANIQRLKNGVENKINLKPQRPDEVSKQTKVG